MKRTVHRRTHLIRTHVHRRIQFQLIFFAIASLALFGFLTYDSLTHSVGLQWVAGGLVFGAILGLIVGQIFNIHWHEPTQKVMMGIDKFGVFLIILYAAFRFFSEQVFGEFLHGQSLTVATYATLGGLMFGRLISIWQRVTRILKQKVRY